MKRCLTLVVIREVQIKTTVRYRFTPIRMSRVKNLKNIGKDGEKLEPLYTAVECKMVQLL